MVQPSAKQPPLRQNLLHRRKIRPMLGQRAIALQRRQMRRRAVAFVLREAVFGMPLMQRIHLGIARGFGENGRGGNGSNLGIAFHHRFGSNG